MNRNEAINLYFRLGFRYTEILASLAHNHGFVMSMRHLKRLLKQNGLYRRKHQSDINDVILFIRSQVEGSGRYHGYRWMHLKCIQEGLIVSRESVRLLLKIIDPQGVQARKRHCLLRRKYGSPGPNFMWHLDSYDKLSPYGICVNGCIDGYSRNVLWAEAYHTNSNPRIVAGYFMSAVELLGGTPAKIRADMGTENGHVEEMQRFMRTDQNCFYYGTSQMNQRIERWWGIFRTQCGQFWMDLFKGLKNDGCFTGDTLDKDLVRFCFMRMIQDELDNIVMEWNCHRLSRSRNAISPTGRPCIMFSVPEIYGSCNFLQSVTQDVIEVCKDESVSKGPYPCDEELFELCCMHMLENNISFPSDSYAAVDLYIVLRNYIREN